MSPPGRHMCTSLPASLLRGSVTLLSLCLLQNVYYTNTQRLHVGLLSPTVDDDDNKCLVDVNGRPRLIECSYAAAKRMKLHWLFTQVITPTSAPHAGLRRRWKVHFKFAVRYQRM